MSKFRNWLLTINNPYSYCSYTNAEIEEYIENNVDLDVISEYANILSDVEDYLHRNNEFNNDEELLLYCEKLPDFRYCVFQRESGEEYGTIHNQMYIEFKQQKTFDTIKKYFPTAHIEERKGTKKQARDYCMKDTTRVVGPFEIGEFSGAGEKLSMADVLKAIEDGATNIEIANKFPTQYMRNLNSINQYRQDLKFDAFRDKFRELEVTYISGVGGVGKTRYVMEKYGYSNVYRTTSYDRSMFDAYNGEDVILFDEFRTSIKNISDLLNYLDGYPLMLPARYNNKVACYTKVYIVSNIPISKQYEELQKNEPTSYQALLRRIHHIYEFNTAIDIVNLDDKKTKYEQMPLPMNNVKFPTEFDV